MNNKAIIIGATGLVGKQLIKELGALYKTLIIIARRPPQSMSKNMQFFQVNDFNNLTESFDNINIDASTDAFSCLGTTKKQAGGEQGFRQVDYQFNLAFAAACRDKGVENFFLLSAMGADTTSRFFYNQVKGELEQAVAELGFARFYVFRPSLLLGKHKGRHLENISQSVFKLISPVVSEKMPAHPISATRVAIAMAMTAHKLYENSQYRQAAVSMVSPIVVSNKEMLAMTRVH